MKKKKNENHKTPIKTKLNENKTKLNKCKSHQYFQGLMYIIYFAISVTVYYNKNKEKEQNVLSKL